MHRFLVGVAAVAGLSTAACSSKNPATDGGESDAGDEVCTPYESDADLTTPVVSFDKDVVPIMNFSCGIAGATCHGVPAVVAQQRPYLGKFDGGTDASQVVTGIVGVKAQEDPSMNIVTASDPAHSYLMHKVDWDECTLAAQCAPSTTQYTNCGQGMPYSSDQLDQPTRDTIRRWIAQGAKNN